MPARPRPLLGLAGAVLLLAGCAGGARGPSPEPTPPVDRPGTPGDRPAAVPVEANAPRGPSVAFAYSSGTRRYAVVTTALVQLAADGALPETDSLETRAYVTYVLGGGGAGQSVGGAIDSVFVTSRRAPATSQAVTTALPFGGTLTASGVQLATANIAPTRCGPGVVDPLVGVARDLVVALPAAIAEGAAWRDSSATATCRGNVLTTASTVHEYRVTRLAEDAGGRTATIERVSRSSITGQGSGGSAGTTLTGTGTAQARFTFDLADGSYRDGEITSATDLAVTADGRAQQLTQRAVTRVALQPR
jgi:hypothetical protein